MTGEINKILLSKLKSKDLNEKAVARVFKDLMLAFSMDPMIDRTGMNNRLQMLGWGHIKLDYRMWELAKASFEMLAEDKKSLSPTREYKKSAGAYVPGSIISN